MNPERMSVLQMLAEGKISAEDAERLLERLQEKTRESPQESVRKDVRAVVLSGIAESAHSGESGSSVTRAVSTGRAPLKFLRIMVQSAKEDVVNIRIPMALVRTGLKLSTMIPEDARERLRDKGVDIASLSGLEGEELIEALRELQVDVDSGKGDTVRIFCE